MNRARPHLVRQGLEAEVDGIPARTLAEQLLQISEAGLSRRGHLSPNGNDEGIHLATLKELVQEGRCPADRLTEGLDNDSPDLRALIIERCQL